MKRSTGRFHSYEQDRAVFPRKKIRLCLELVICAAFAVFSGAGFFTAQGMAQASTPAQASTAPQTNTPAQANTAAQTKQQPDSVVSAAVTRKLMASETLRPLGLGILVHDGTAILTGTVPTPELRQQAEDAVKSVDGIHRVDNRITIGSAPKPAPGASAVPKAGGANASTPGEMQTPASPPGQLPPPGYDSGSRTGGNSYSQPNEITLPAGTPAYVMIEQPIDSQHTKPGDPFRGVLIRDMLDKNGVIAVPRGADVIGTVIDARGPGHLKGHPELALQLTGLNIADTSYPLTSNVWARGGPGKGKQSVAGVGAGAALGAMIGGAAGGGGTAALGGVLGGLGGAGISALSSGPQLLVPAESVLTFSLKEPLTVQAPTRGEIQMLDSRVPPPNRGYGNEYGGDWQSSGPDYPPLPPGTYPSPSPPPGGPPGGYPY